jgi:hypothetical protein
MLFAVSSFAHSQGKEPICGVKFETPADVNDYFESNPKLALFLETPTHMTFFERPTTMWLVTREGHPAHLSVFCGGARLKDGKEKAETGFICFASEKQCDEFTAGLSKNMKKQLNKTDTP